MASSMQFWAVEVKAGQPLKVETAGPYLIHLSQAALEQKKEKPTDSIVLSAKVDGQKIVLGTLSADKFPQLSFDLVFEKEFELSHNGKSGSIHLSGYETLAFDEGDSEDDSEEESESEEEDVPVAVKLEQPVEKVKPAAAKAKASEAKVAASKPKENAKPSKIVAPVIDSDDEDDSDVEGDSDDDLSGSSDEEEMSVDEDDEAESEDEDTPTPKKKVDSKKRPIDSASKTPVSTKKAKANTPQKSDGKKAGHVSTPHPSKKDGKASANGKPSPKSGGQFSCKSCEKVLGSDGALRAHTQAKHSAAK